MRLPANATSVRKSRAHIDFGFPDTRNSDTSYHCHTAIPGGRAGRNCQGSAYDLPNALVLLHDTGSNANICPYYFTYTLSNPNPRSSSISSAPTHPRPFQHRIQHDYRRHQWKQR